MPKTIVPKSAKRVFKGTISDVYQWPQKMYDGTTKMFEVIRRQDTVLVITAVKDKIVVLKQIQPQFRQWYYGVPSGRMDKAGETPRQTAERELLEETGLKPRRLKLWKTVSVRGKVMHTLYMFIAQDSYKIAKQTLDDGEKIKVYFYTFEQFLKLSDHPHFYEGELLIYLLRARLDKKFRTAFHKAIFD